MKPNDKAIEAALAEGKRWRVRLNRPEDHISCWKVLREADDFGYDVIAEFNSREERDEALERLRAEAMVTAAYAAQFQSEDYAGLIERLRKDISDLTGKMISDWDSWRKYIASGGDSSWPRDQFEGHLDAIAEIHHSAADAIEALLADRDIYKNWLDNYEKLFAAKVEELVTARLERDALAARLAPVVVPVGDGITDDLAAIQQQGDTKGLVEIKSHLPHKSAQQIRDETDQLIKKHRKSVRDWLEAGRIAPVDDEVLVEIACDAFNRVYNNRHFTKEAQQRASLAAAIAAIRPHIEAAERERCAKIAEGSFLFDVETWLNSTKKEMTAHISYAIAAAIRSGK